MKRIAIAAVAVASIVAVPVVVAADSGGQANDGPYAGAHNVSSPLGPLYGPVKAGPQSSTSYGYIAK
jgi:hypothetical protein